MLFLRRFVVVVALMFWQGGFTFYSAVVVPVGQKVIGQRRQSLVTRAVTNYMNISGAVALLPLAWDLIAARDRRPRRRRWRWASWAVMAVGLVFLAWLHVSLDEQMGGAEGVIDDRTVFRTGHRWYLWISTVQWAAGLIYLALMVRAWREEDVTRADGRAAAGGTLAAEGGPAPR